MTVKEASLRGKSINTVDDRAEEITLMAWLCW